MWTYLISFWKQVFNDQRLKTSQELWMLSLVPLKDVSVFCSLLSEMVTSLENRFQNVFGFLSVHVFSSLCGQMSEKSPGSLFEGVLCLCLFVGQYMICLSITWITSQVLKRFSTMSRRHSTSKSISDKITCRAVLRHCTVWVFGTAKREAVYSKKNIKCEKQKQIFPRMSFLGWYFLTTSHLIHLYL